MVVKMWVSGMSVCTTNSGYFTGLETLQSLYLDSTTVHVLLKISKVQHL